MKILGKVLLLIIFLHVSLNATMSAHVDSTAVTLGDSVNFELRLVGKDIEKPRLSKLCGEKITSTSQMQSSQYINGSFTSQTTYSYMFTPTKSCVIKAISLTIDGKVEQSEAIKIKVSKMKITKDSDFILELKNTKADVYVGEPFQVELFFKQKRNASGVDSKFQPPNFQGFWVKKESEGRKFYEGDYVVTKLTYIIAAQKSGALSISPANMKIATRTNSRDNWGQWLPSLKWRSYFSNELVVNVKPLPANTTLVGQFKIEMALDKKVVEANEPLNITFKIKGIGNFEDIESLKPDIAGVSIYAEDPKANEFFDKGNYVGEFSQKMAIVADRNYTIPSVELKFFNTITGQIEVITSSPIPIEVKGTSLVQESKRLHVERANTQVEPKVKIVQKGIDTLSAVAIFIGGIFLGVLMMLIPFKKYFAKDSNSLHVNIKDKKVLLMFLLQHRDDKEASTMVDTLEAILYRGSSEMIDTKVVKTLVKRLQE